MHTKVTIRPFEDYDAPHVRELFINVNRLLSPPDMHEAFEAYIARSLTEEMDRVSAYYAEHGGSFWVAVRNDKVVGMFGLESTDNNTFELRRMYVDPSARRTGIASMMLRFAEDQCRRSGGRRIELSTSELQPAAKSLYAHSKYRLMREVIAETANNKTIGGGIRRYYFEKQL
jgi:GNAT superfamily N-acetyltransferase